MGFFSYKAVNNTTELNSCLTRSVCLSPCPASGRWHRGGRTERRHRRRPALQQRQHFGRPGPQFAPQHRPALVCRNAGESSCPVSSASAVIYCNATLNACAQLCGGVGRSGQAAFAGRRPLRAQRLRQRHGRGHRGHRAPGGVSVEHDSIWSAVEFY